MGQRLPVGVGIVVMVHGIVANRDSSGVIIVVIGKPCRLDRHRIAASNATGFPEERKHRQPLLRRKDVVSDANAGIAQLVLDEIDESQRTELCLLEGLSALFRRHH